MIQLPFLVLELAVSFDHGLYFFILFAQGDVLLLQFLIIDVQLFEMLFYVAPV